ncbi:MAG: FlgD immunoglobulin-like domain containing protein [bacterium]
MPFRTIRVLALSALLLILLAHIASANYLGDITVSRESPASLKLGTKVEVACDWKWTGGDYGEEMYVHAWPMTNGELSPGAMIVDSGPYDVGEGRAWPAFTITSGETVVDEILLYMEGAPDKNTRYLEVSIPVNLHFGSHAFRNISMNFESPDNMAFGQYVYIDFIWESTYTAGKRIVARPLANGVYPPNMAVSGTGIITGSSAWATRYFTVTAGQVEIDEIQFLMYNDDWSTLLYEFRLPVSYVYDSTAIQNIVLSPGTPGSLKYIEDVTIDFDYVTDYPIDLRVTAKPQSGGYESPGAEYGPTYPLAPMSGHGTNTFTIEDPSSLVDVDAIRFRMYDYFDDTFVYECFLPVNYHYAISAIDEVTLTPPSPAILSHDENVYLEIRYDNGRMDNGWLYTHPFTRGAETPNWYGANRSLAYPGTNPPVSQFFRIISGDVLVDQLRFTMYDLDDVELWMNYFVDTWLYFGTSAITTPVIETEVPAIPQLLGNHPNPFNPLTTIDFAVDRPQRVSISVFDVLGRRVAVIADRQFAAGTHSVQWDGRDGAGQAVCSGTYLMLMETEGGAQSKKMMLVR